MFSDCQSKDGGGGYPMVSGPFPGLRSFLGERKGYPYSLVPCPFPGGGGGNPSQVLRHGVSPPSARTRTGSMMS